MAVTVDDLKSALDCETDIALAERLGVERSTVAQWRRREGVPKGWHFVLKIKDVEAQSLAARRRLFSDGDGYYIQMAALSVLEPTQFDWPMLTADGRGQHIQQWILKAASYVIQVLGSRNCDTLADYEQLVRELNRPEHRAGLNDWLYP